MPVVSVRIDDKSSYTIEFEDEYSFPDFVKIIEKHSHVINQIVASQSQPGNGEGLGTSEAVHESGQDGVALPDAGPEHSSTPKESKKMDTFKKAGKRRVFTTVLVVLLFILGGGFLFRFFYGENSAAGRNETTVAGSPVQKVSISAPVAAPGKNPPVPLPELNKLLIEARETAWIKVAEDYNPAYKVVLRPGERLEREATRFVLMIGNVKGVDISFNDKKVSLVKSGAKSMGKTISVTLPKK